MSDFDKRFNRMRWFISIFIGFVFVLVICYLIAIGVFAYKAGSAVNGGGIKPMIEKLWCGKPGCFDGQQSGEK